MADTIQERLREPIHEAMLRNARDMTEEQEAQRCEAADRIAALEKALDAAEVLANEVQDLPDGPYHAMYVALCHYRVAHDALKA